MGGLVVALCLKKYAPDVRFDIYESAPELTEVGAGIGMTLRIWSLMKELGLEEELFAIQGTRDRDGMHLSPPLTSQHHMSARVPWGCRFELLVSKGRRGASGRCR